jgi:hypothetical protein
MALKQEKVLYQEGYDIGIGVAMASGSPMRLGARGEVTAPQIGTGGSSSFTFRRIDTNEDLETELGISADISAGIGLFSGSASFDFSKKCKIQSSSLTVLVSAEERFAFEQMDEPRLTEEAGVLVENGKLEEFADKYGEYFIRGIRTGGRFFGVVRIDTNSVQSKTEVDAALSASYGLTMSGDVKVNVSEAMSRANAKAEAFIMSDGGHFTTHPTSNDPVKLLEQLYKAMDEWTASVRDDPKPYSVTLAPYIIALGPTPPNIAEIEHQRDVLIRCARLRSQTMDKLNLIDYMLDPQHMDEFESIPPPEGPDLPDLQARLAGDLDVIADAASFAINNLKEACDPETFMRTIQNVPDFKLTALPPNLPKHTGGKLVLPNVRVPDLLSVDFFSLVDALLCLQHGGGLEGCLDGTAFPGQDDIPTPLAVSREIAEFLSLSVNGKLRIIWVPGDPGDMVAGVGGPTSFSLQSQSPPPGTEISMGSEVIVQILAIPE